MVASKVYYSVDSMAPRKAVSMVALRAVQKADSKVVMKDAIKADLLVA